MTPAATSVSSQSQQSTLLQSKQKASLLLQMANAVEDSSVRQRQKLHDNNNVSAETVNDLLWDLQNGGDDKSKLQQQQQHPVYSSSSVIHPQQVQLMYSAMIRYRENAELRYSLLELRHLDLSKSFVELENRYRQLQVEQEAWKQSCEALQQAATESEMSCSSRTNGSSRRGRRKPSPTPPPAQRHVKPSLSFNSTVPILQQELKMLSSQRNQLLQANLELRKQLKQMQIQMQTPKEGEDVMMATCRRCHPELLAGRQQFATDTFAILVQEFQPSTNNNTLDGTTSHHRNHKEEEEEKELVEEEMKQPKPSISNPLPQESEFVPQQQQQQQQQQNNNSHSSTLFSTDDEASFETQEDDDPMDSTMRREENKHQDKMNLLGLQLSTRQLVVTRDATDPRGLWGSQHHKSAEQPTLPQPVKQKSIVWSPQEQQHDQHHQQQQSQRIKAKPQMVPTMNNILPMQQQQQQNHPKMTVQDIQVAPRKETTRKLNIPNTNNTKEIPIQPPVTARHHNNHSGMDRYGQLDEFGRSSSYRIVGTNSANSSNHSGTTVPVANTSTNANAATGTNNSKGGMSLFRRKSAAVVPTQPLASTQSQQQQQRRNPQRHSMMGPPLSPPPNPAGKIMPPVSSPLGAIKTPSLAAAANARHLEHHSRGNQQQQTAAAARHATSHPQQQQQPPPPQSSSLIMNIRHLEFAATGNTSTPQHPPPSATTSTRIQARTAQAATTGQAGRRVAQPVHKRSAQDGKGAPTTNSAGTAQSASTGQPGRRVAQPVHKRPVQDGKGAPTTNSAGMPARNHHPNTKRNGVNRPNAAATSGRPNLVGPASRGGPLAPNNRDHHHQTVANRPHMPTQNHHAAPHHHAARTAPAGNKSNGEERKAEKASRPQSYFERIKKTLQQEI